MSDVWFNEFTSNRDGTARGDLVDLGYNYGNGRSASKLAGAVSERDWEITCQTTN